MTAKTKWRIADVISVMLLWGVLCFHYRIALDWWWLLVAFCMSATRITSAEFEKARKA